MIRVGICFIICALFIEIVCVANGVTHAAWMISALLTLVGISLISAKETMLEKLIVKHEEKIKELKNNNE